MTDTATPIPSVIVADDDADIRTLVAMAVTRAGLDLIDELDDGDQAWEAIQSFHPDIVVLDVNMPGKTGLELARLVRADEALAGIRVILLSAGVDDHSRQAGIDAGADEYLTKPFSPKVLAAHLTEVAAHLGVRA